MAPTIATRISALEREGQALAQRAERTNVKLNDLNRRGDMAHQLVAPLFDSARELAIRADKLSASLDRADFWNTASSAQQRTARAAIAAAINGARTVAQTTLVGDERHTETTVSVTDARSGASADNWKRARAGQDLPNTRIVGSIPQAAANLVADRLDNVGAKTIALVDALGGRATLFSGKLTDVWGFRHLRNDHPRGWPDDATWERVPGVAIPPDRWAGNPNREITGRGHGAASLALHEYAHIVDVAIARPHETRLSKTDRWARTAQREVRHNDSSSEYVRKHPEEWFAEAFARYHRDPQSHAALARWYPKTFSMLKRELGPARFS